MIQKNIIEKNSIWKPSRLKVVLFKGYLKGQWQTLEPTMCMNRKHAHLAGLLAKQLGGVAWTNIVGEQRSQNTYTNDPWI